ARAVRALQHGQCRRRGRGHRLRVGVEAKAGELMATLEEPPAVVDAPNPLGFGRMTRKEDARFIRGQGTYVDDVQLPGMLPAAILRSPYAPARTVRTAAPAALQHPRVHAVITGSDLEARGLAWMPTISRDTQAVLATDKVRYQGQEVAFVIAD